MSKRTTDDLRQQAALCFESRAAAILTGVAAWLDGVSVVDGDLDPHEFADMWTEDKCKHGCRLRKAVAEFMSNTTPEY